jgi:L-lactate dehydrogenase
MFENLFIPQIDLTSPIAKKDGTKAAIIGIGQVGMACAYSMLIQNTLDVITLIDINQQKLAGEVMDLQHGLPFVEPTLVYAGKTLADAAGADIVIITAGAKQQPGESRLDLVQRNVEIFKKLIPELVQYCPDAIFLIVSNPVDIMTYITGKISGFPSCQVIGSGTVLDTARFRYLLAHRLNLDPRSIHGLIIGEHGDSEVPVWSQVNISGTKLCGEICDEICDENWPESPSCNQPFLQEIFAQVKNAAYDIIQRKGATSYAIGLGVTQIVQAILRNQNRVMTVSSLIKDFHGIQDVCLSLPMVVNRQGATKMVNINLTDTELSQLQHSANVLKEIIAKLNL